MPCQHYKENMSSAAKVMDTVIAIGIGLIVAVALIAGALTNFFATATSTWSTSVAAVWGLVAILAVLAIALGFFYAVKGHIGGKRGMARIFLLPRGPSKAQVKRIDEQAVSESGP